jgi:long-subunit fatty acid transport protein
MCRTAGVIILALLITLPAFALEKVGTTSMQVLKIPIGVRGVGMGNAMCGLVDDAEAVWWNPGALTEVAGDQAIVSQINMPADIQLNSFVLAHRIGDYQTVTVHAINLFTDDMPVRTYEQPTGTGQNFNASDLAIGASYARKLTDRFSLGGNVRYLHSGLEDESYDGIAVDLGTLYKTSLRTLQVGMAIQNLGPEVKYSGTFLDYRGFVQNNGELLEKNYEGASLPTMFRLGVAFDFMEMFKIEHGPDHRLDLAIEMNHPNDNKERLNLGTEYAWKERMMLRAGGKFGYDEETFSLGFGILIPLVDNYRFRFDYAYSYWGRLTDATSDFMSQPHRFALGFQW